MKKLLIALVALFAILPMAARDRVTSDVNALPARAQNTLSKYFGKTKVNHIKIESHTFGGDDYDVILDNGTEIDFDSKGDWKEIDCGHREVPSGLILPAISNYVAKNFKGQKIVSLDKDGRKYDVQLSSGIELEFDRSGAFRRVDD